jgi:SAM domain (Sterile alpha motif)/Adenylate and Guanylate cyclase catalytic domain
MDVAQWLQDLGLPDYTALFREQAIDADVLPSLTDADFEKLGLPLGHRKKLLTAMAALGAAPSSTVSIRRPSHAERRQLTVMFVDLVGSTSLSTRLDPEDMRETLTAYQNAVAGEIARFEGHLAKFMGDGVLAYFGWPRAHEDEAERAVTASLAIVEAVDRLRSPDGRPTCRAGRDRDRPRCRRRSPRHWRGAGGSGRRRHPEPRRPPAGRGRRR